MYATDQDQAPKRTDRKSCPGCGASVAGCEGVRWLRGFWCCPRCAGNHDHPITERTKP